MGVTDMLVRNRLQRLNIPAKPATCQGKNRKFLDKKGASGKI
jgi:hypothetical protein